ncbi:cheW-like domain protein [Anoxybacillus sp. B7M1]|uniref:Chemotaxis protein CheW n=1 Tax=Anoxybacteroides rupiense TaxID=311460 RepID=A0ABT5W2W2_9BACL|nr:MULTISPECIES: chemotaxis protein CheW [Anoxybacillus]ANB56461.1 cheW-like domain protein [Anoxybacillus sp. B2M1]ANB65996.1 cheW-like domain protein [Anoxybacillus sp. B7M1]KXG10570.1 Chemotaxis protein CheW [Anoxybacillus sp. P3H1B]MBB3906146.1 purine-binding chemotaxis protein CheW [Anoxybacillus rupiensis]MBS2771029.1 chemotaxis protein CheW [Anoxybacillus rupiensis]
MVEVRETELKVIVFQLKDEEYAIPVQQVRSIEKVQHITRVPRTPKFVKGVINLRGVVTPIIDLRERFGIESQSFNEQTRVIIVALGEIEVGLIVDAANDVLDIPVKSIEPPPEVIEAIEADYINGVAKVGKRLLILLNLEKVLDAEKSVLA